MATPGKLSGTWAKRDHTMNTATQGRPSKKQREADDWIRLETAANKALHKHKRHKDFTATEQHDAVFDSIVGVRAALPNAT